MIGNEDNNDDDFEGFPDDPVSVKDIQIGTNNIEPPIEDDNEPGSMETNTAEKPIMDNNESGSVGTGTIEMPVPYDAT